MTSKLELSAYGAKLLNYLDENFPELERDDDFYEMVNQQAKQAAHLFGQERLNGRNVLDAQDSANEILFSGFHFSPFSIINNIAMDLDWSKYREPSREELIEVAKELIPIIEEYGFNDDFIYDTEYDRMEEEIKEQLQKRFIL